MNKENKKDLVKRGLFRAAINTGAVIGLSCFKPELAWAYMMGAYGNIALGLKYTAYKMNEREEWEPHPEPTNLREYYLKGPEYIEEPCETLYERIEGKAIDLIEENTPIIVGKIKAGFNKIRKSKLKINTEKSSLKGEQNEDIKEPEKDFLK